MKAISTLICSSILGACATTGTAISRSEGEYANRLVLSEEAKSVLRSQGAVLPERAPLDAVVIYLAKSVPGETSRKEVNKATARALIMTSDAACEQYMASFLFKARTTTSVLGVSSLALSTAAGVTTPVESANLLSALSAFTIGAQDRLTKTIVADKAPELLYKSVMAVRAQERARLLTLLESRDLGDAAPDVVMAQLAEYHGRCGPTVGINGLTDSVQVTADRADKTGADQANEFVARINAPVTQEAAQPQGAAQPK